MCTSISRRIPLIIFFSFISTINALASEPSYLYPFESIYQFGDSLADTGNHVRQVGAPCVFNTSNWPYGMTYFHKPTGRFSDGLLIVDFVAKALNLPFLNPYLNRNANFDHGVSFAVGGSTALDNDFLTERNIIVPSTNIPLSHQMGWFKEHLKSISSDDVSKREKLLEKALIIMGEFGGNDIDKATTYGWSLEEMRKEFVPFMIDSISQGVKETIHLGARYIIVPGVLPQGCLPSTLTQFPSSDARDYDDRGCLRSFNEFVTFFNGRIQTALDSLRAEFPNVSILYFDYYEAFESLLHDAVSLGFDESSLHQACCGSGGKYNYNDKVVCGSKGVKLCRDPTKVVHWDGIHTTQATYRYISHRLIHDVLPKVTYADM